MAGMEDGGGIEFATDSINSWLGAWQLNLNCAQDRDRGEVRRIWARVAFAALDGAERAGYPARDANASRFNLRASLIADLGRGDDPLWDPDQLAVDVLDALPLTLDQASEWVADWRARPRDEIFALRVCKTLLNPMRSISDLLAEGPVRTRIERWLDLRPRLP
ncbi:hypothetical protein Misp01_47650 [Microtetraspora sp. NBRC 13810]|uniref:hypothetical protein n=1 Tax=Microtetraspora sp. NBRC 13810 TaxID=3030990 RepID=UPI0024A49635|nr:hypothetical protein [Microtetraspora sp. NBRC 13810]GLW09636.1 hypothetical protein Misp01_47650 [Microtetraspora sp. NBRC 13810]